MYILITFVLIVISVGWVLILKEVIQNIITWVTNHRGSKLPSKKDAVSEQNRNIIYDQA